MNTLIKYVIKDNANVCNPNKTQNDSHVYTSLAYLMPRPRRNAQTIIQTLGPCTVEGVQGLFFHSGLMV